MPKLNGCIVSMFMKNIDMKTVELQQKVVKKFNPSGYPHYSVLTDFNHGYSMDKFIETNSEMAQLNHDLIMYLDIDCVPINDKALDHMFEKAAQGILIGDAQRSNHIQNNQHVFCAPHNITFSLETYDKLGRPSFLPTTRGDVGEELTFRAEERKIPVEIIMPTKYDAPPIRMAWEVNQPPYWPLADGMPVYGIGTTYGDMFYHNFQIFHEGQQQRFWNKCEELL